LLPLATVYTSPSDQKLIRTRFQLDCHYQQVLW
jgi:hypothetical protein